MLDHLDIKRKTITADAMHCQKTLVRRSLNKAGGQYVFGLKGNQLKEFEDVKLFLEDPKSYFSLSLTLENRIIALVA